MAKEQMMFCINGHPYKGKGTKHDLFNNIITLASYNWEISLILK